MKRSSIVIAIVAALGLGGAVLLAKKCPPVPVPAKPPVEAPVPPVAAPAVQPIAPPATPVAAPVVEAKSEPAK